MNALTSYCPVIILMKDGYDIRFIVVNDGSKRGFTEEAVLRLTNNLPSTIIVDNKTNQGKGAAVRDGIAYSDSELALYTDYDFPYKIESVCQVIKYLEAGYDVVVAPAESWRVMLHVS